MSMLEEWQGEVEDPAGGFSGEPAAVMRAAGWCCRRRRWRRWPAAGRAARCGEPVTLTGPGGLVTGVIGQVLQAGLAAELDAHLDDGEGTENRRNGSASRR